MVYWAAAAIVVVFMYTHTTEMTMVKNTWSALIFRRATKSDHSLVHEGSVHEQNAGP